MQVAVLVRGERADEPVRNTESRRHGFCDCFAELCDRHNDAVRVFGPDLGDVVVWGGVRVQAGAIIAEHSDLERVVVNAECRLVLERSCVRYFQEDLHVHVGERARIDGRLFGPVVRWSLPDTVEVAVLVRSEGKRRSRRFRLWSLHAADEACGCVLSSERVRAHNVAILVFYPRVGNVVGIEILRVKHGGAAFPATNADRVVGVRRLHQEWFMLWNIDEGGEAQDGRKISGTASKQMVEKGGAER